MKSIKLLLTVCVLCVLASCGKKYTGSGWRYSDDVYVAIDETFRPIMAEELEAFRLQHVESGDKAEYCSEDSAIQMLVNDSIRCCVVTRPLSDAETNRVKANRLPISKARIATDAFALIVNKEVADSVLNIEDIKGIVSGKITRWEQLRYATRKGELSLVFDKSGSSTVRYMRDSLLNGQDIKGNVFAQGSNEAVIDLVKKDAGVIGVVGTNWLKEPKERVLDDFSDLDVKVLKVSRDNDDNPVGFRPYQYRILTGDYPLTRAVYVISTDPRRGSNVNLFYFFLKGQKGQTILCNGSQLLPYSPVQVKSVSTN